MAANRKGSKFGAGSTPKKKASAAQHAQTRAQAQQHMAEAPRVRRSHKEVDQSRFPGETPLSGEDRPRDRTGGKQQRFEQDRKIAGHGQARRTPVNPGELSLRRGRQKKGASARAD